MHLRSSLWLATLAIFTAVAACSAAGGDKTFSGVGAAGSGAAGSVGASMDSTGPGIGTGGGGGQHTGPGCSKETSLIYTLAADNSLYTFDPPTLTFSLVGVLDCPSAELPFSMAVSRDGQAWTVFTDGSLFKVDTSNAHCTATSFVPGQSGWTTFGMGFSSDSPGSDEETLYVSEAAFVTGAMTKGLGKIDTQTMTLTPIGMYDALSARAELTGTGDARLFGAFEGMPYIVSEIEKQTAKIKSQAPQTAINYAPDASNFAFAFWGGDFWLFVGPGTSTDVFHYVPATKMTTKVKTVSYEIVGAGVSTCAPVTPPN